MNVENLARQLASVRFENGHVFENGAHMCETLGYKRAQGLLKALQEHGIILSYSQIDSPSISSAEAEVTEATRSTANAGQVSPEK